MHGISRRLGIRYREKEGAFLSQGVKALSKKIGNGSEKFAVHVKGMELPAYDPRPIPGMALAYSTASRGGCHLRAWTIADDLGGKLPLYSIEGRAKLVYGIQNLRSFIDCSGMCLFAMKAMPLPQLAKAVNVVTGMNLTPDDALKIGERVFNLERLLLARSGVTRSDDTLAERFFTEPIKTGPHTGQKLSKESFETMKDEYYQLRGWSQKTGIPEEQKIKELKVAEEKQPKSADYSHDSQGIKVKATLNGRVDADLVLDTGASLVMITRRIAQEMRLNLRNAPDLRVQLADGRQVSAKHVIIDTMKVQGIMVDDVEAVVLTDEVKGLNFGDGLLGMSFLKRFNFKVDQKEKKLILEKL